MTKNERREVLLTPGPLTTSAATKEAMLRDWGSRDHDFKALTKRMRERLTALAGASADYSCVPLQGSGTFAVEAMLGTFVPRDGRVLILVNGAYGQRMAKICAMLGRAHDLYETDEHEPPDPDRLDEILAGDPSLTHVAAVHCETTSGILNPVADLAAVVRRHGRAFLIDAMSSFGALPIDVADVPCVAIAASANKCLEGVPGLGFVIARTDALEAATGNASSLSLDLADQSRALKRTGEWRFTPPTQVIAAFDAALDQHKAEGGVAGRGKRYAENCKVLVEGMRRLGFETFLPDTLQAPIIVTFRTPADPGFDFERFYDGLHARGFVIYPGKLTNAPSFRIGCIGQVDADDMRAAVAAVAEVLEDMGVGERAPS